ncbi:MAG TPA: hypothetical protein VIY29_19045 [Ktedonobacteraceae bacterium]
MSVPPYVPRPNAGDEDEEQAANVEEGNEVPLPIDELPADETPETAAADRDPSLPPVAVYETNGGPLGCCLGIVVGLLVSVLLGVFGFGQVSANIVGLLVHVDVATTIRIATAFFAIVGAALGGYFGWKVGKRLYRDYEPPVVKDRRRKAKATPKEAK